MGLYPATEIQRLRDSPNRHHPPSFALRHRHNFIRIGEHGFALAMRVVPRSHRFHLAALIARGAEPMLRRTDAYREQEIKNFHNPYEISLHLVLNALTKNATTFAPPIVVKGFDELARAHSAGKGVLVIGHHAALTLLMVRFLYDQEVHPIVITPDPQMSVAGTSVTVRTIQPSPSFLLKLRSSLRRGEVVCAMPDRAEHEKQRTFDFAIPGGRVIVAPALMQVATRCGAKVIFAEIHAERNILAGTLATPSASDVDTITDDFVAFVRATTGSASAAETFQGG